ncbi:helix-turn-helix domain-containing protein [Aminobacter aganoensis]|uniref:Putative transcriptional regulator n=1 Tax=Aminobacter aganoensis TaxID=83264 RepID=A0A7X0F8D3_9HYPH|nr:helix-turn-helix domain-containing protein [Aminobacter aganoensis]MBB6355023.1 putative transcriptional regulator [Aminobacter aganoensis]
MVDDIDNPDWTEERTRPLDAAAKLKLVRGLLDMSQGDFAALLGIPVTTLQNWEQRRTEPDAVARTLIDLIHDDPQEMRARMMRRNAA